MNRKHFDAAWVAALLLFFLGACIAIYALFSNDDVNPLVFTSLLFGGLFFYTLA